MIKYLFLVLALAGCCSRPAWGLTAYYVASGYSGTANGTAAEPWRSLDANKWATINAALLIGDVTIYFSARQASSDAELYHSSTGSSSVADGIEVWRRTDTSAHFLTFDGRSYYNQNDTTPSWAAYSGSNASRVRNFVGQNDATPHDRIRIDGFHIACAGDEKAVSFNGSYWTVTNCQMEHTSFVSGGGPLVLFTPTADGAHQGSSAYASAFGHCVLSNNVIFKSQGEAVYVGGGGSSPGTAGSGYPSHDDIRIVKNVIHDAGYWGDQGDGIDVKGGITNLQIDQNEIYRFGLDGSNPARAITAQGLYNVVSDTRQITRNYIHDSSGVDDGAIAIVDSWGTPGDTLVAGNIIDTISRNGGQVGIKVYTTGGLISIFNNTIYNCAAYAVEAIAGSRVKLRNNLLLENNSAGEQLSLSGTVESSDYNGYSVAIGFLGEGAHSFSTSSVGNLLDAANGNFQLIGSAPAQDAGVAVSYTLDFAGVTRPQGAGFDVGAYERVGAVVAVSSEARAITRGKGNSRGRAGAR